MIWQVIIIDEALFYTSIFFQYVVVQESLCVFRLVRMLNASHTHFLLISPRK